MTVYTKQNDPWVDYPGTTTPITAADLDGMEAGIATAHSELQAHLDDGSDAHDASAISIVDTGGYFAGTDVEAALQESAADIAAMGTPASLALIIALG